MLVLQHTYTAIYQQSNAMQSPTDSKNNKSSSKLVLPEGANEVREVQTLVFLLWRQVF